MECFEAFWTYIHIAHDKWHDAIVVSFHSFDREDNILSSDPLYFGIRGNFKSYGSNIVSRHR